MVQYITMRTHINHIYQMKSESCFQLLLSTSDTTNCHQYINCYVNSKLMSLYTHTNLNLLLTLSLVHLTHQSTHRDY